MIIELIIKILCLCSITTILVESEPIILLKRYFGFKEELIENYNRFKKFICKLIYCNWCLSFWVSLIITQDIKITLVTTFIMWFIESILRK